jgi:glutathione peroxidase
MYKLTVAFMFFIQTSIYSIHFKSNDGTDMSFNQFKGKKILLVNSSSGSKYAWQYGSLENLYQKYKDSLIVIAFPSNDFGHESASDPQIRSSINSAYKINYILAAKTSVTGTGKSPVFQWLTSSSMNGVLDNPVNGDFYKYLVDGNGQIIGVFSGSVDPMDSTIQKAITN